MASERKSDPIGWLQAKMRWAGVLASYRYDFCYGCYFERHIEEYVEACYIGVRVDLMEYWYNVVADAPDLPRRDPWFCVEQHRSELREMGLSR